MKAKMSSSNIVGPKEIPLEGQRALAIRSARRSFSALHADFVQHGASVIQQVREGHPEQYLKVVASLIPKELHVQDASLEDMSDSELMDIIAVLRSQIAKGAGEATEH